MKDRIRALRKALDMTQKEFAEKIGLKQNAISYMEKSGATVTEQNIKAVCSQFNVNESWLRTGAGKMFIENEKKQKEFFGILTAYDNDSVTIAEEKGAARVFQKKEIALIRLAIHF